MKLKCLPFLVMPTAMVGSVACLLPAHQAQDFPRHGAMNSFPLADRQTHPVPPKGDLAKGPDPTQTSPVTTPDAAGTARLGELDAYWATVSRAVKQGDFDAYRATCHEEGVLVSGSKQTSQPLSQALERWKPEFVDTHAGQRQSDVAFRFSKRLGDATTAHETGIFRYTAQLPGQLPKVEYIHFEGLLVRKPDGWKILMENQIGPATKEAWEALEPPLK